MSTATTRYTARFRLPELFERGRDEAFRCETYRDGQLAVPSAGSVTVYDAAGSVVATPAVSIVGGIATATLLGATTSPLLFDEGWHVEWVLTMPDTIQHRFRNDAYLVHYRLYPVISDIDIARRLRALDLNEPSAITTRTTHQDAIDEADVELQLRLIEKGRRPWLVATPSALRMSWLHLAIAIELESLATQNAALRETAQDWRARYESAFTNASAQFDYDQDGMAELTGRESVRRSGFWVC